MLTPMTAAARTNLRQRGSGLLFERNAALRAIDDALRDAADGVGVPVLIEGPPGIGKTKLLQAAAERAILEGFECVTARASQLERGYPFGVVRQLFEASVHDHGT